MSLTGPTAVAVSSQLDESQEGQVHPIRTGPSGDRIRGLRDYLSANPDAATKADPPAMATLGDDLRCKISGGGRSLYSDMPSALGGVENAPSPGWYLRAALAACTATVIAMRAAELAIVLTNLTVTTESRSDARGLLGDDNVVPGPTSIEIIVTLSSSNASVDQLSHLVAYANEHAPVSDGLRRAVPIQTTLNIADRQTPPARVTAAQA